MARSGDLGWAGPGRESLERSKKGESRKEMGREGRRGEILLRTVAGGLGRHFGGSGLSTHPF